MQILSTCSLLGRRAWIKKRKITKISISAEPKSDLGEIKSTFHDTLKASFEEI